MRDRLTDSLQNNGADYVEVRYEERTTTRVSYRGRRLEEASLSSDSGGCVRALVDGGWGFASFNDIDALEECVTRAVDDARMSSGEALALPEREPFEASAVSMPARDVMSVSLDEKVALTGQLFHASEGLEYRGDVV